MADDPRLSALQAIQAFFDRSTACLTEEDSAFAPQPGMFTTAQQVAHTAQSLEWFLEGAFRPEGFNLDFPGLEKSVRAVDSLEAARAWWSRATESALRMAREMDPDAWDQPIAEGPIMGGAPRHAVIEGISDHTAHHRGALTVYARLCGRTPVMPYD